MASAWHRILKYSRREIDERDAERVAARANARLAGEPEEEIRYILAPNEEAFLDNEGLLAEKEPDFPAGAFVTGEIVDCGHEDCAECPDRHACIDNPRIPFQHLWRRSETRLAEALADPQLGPKIRKYQEADEQYNASNDDEKLRTKRNKAYRALRKQLNSRWEFEKYNLNDVRELTSPEHVRQQLVRIYEQRFGEDLAAACAAVK